MQQWWQEAALTSLSKHADGGVGMKERALLLIMVVEFKSLAG
jgi:hypothetical protein